MKLSEIIAFPKEKESYEDLPMNTQVVPTEICLSKQYVVGFNSALKKCDVEVELDVDVVELELERAKQEWISFESNGCTLAHYQAQAIADNLPKLLKKGEWDESKRFG